MDSDIQAQIEKAASVLRAAGAREVYVFGSAARGDSREGSDVDLAVSGLPPQVFYKAIGQAGDVLGRPLDLVDLDEETPFARYLRDEGELQLVE